MIEFTKDEFTKGQTLYLTLVREIENIDYYGETYLSQTLKDAKGRFHKLKVLPFHKDDNQKIGDILEVFVTNVYPDFSPKITFSGIPEAVFIELSSFSKAVKSTFNEIVSYSSTNDKFNIDKQYKSKNGNWVWTFLKSLKAIQNDRINNHDFDGFKKFQLIQLEVAQTIINGKFLLEYGEEKRKTIKNRLDLIINENSSILDLINKVIDTDENENEKQEKIFSFIDQWPVTENNRSNLDSNYKVHCLFTIIEQYISNEIIEKTLLKVLTFNSENYNLKVQLNEWSSLRKKRIRAEVFNEDHHNPKISQSFHLKDNSQLKHLIALTKFDYEVNSQIEDGKYTSVLLKSSLMRYDGYLNNDVESVKNAITFLYENTGKDTLINDNFHRESWRFSFNFELAMCYRFLGKNSTLLEDTIKFYKSAFLFSSKTRSKNQIVDQGFVKYFEMAQLIEDGSSLKEIKDLSRENLIFYGELRNQASIKEEFENNNFLSQLLDLFKILKSIKFNNDIQTNWGARENMHELFDYSMKKYSIFSDNDQQINIDRLYLSEIAALVLASNLIGDVKHELLQSQLSKVFSKGVVEVQKFSTNEIDVDSEEYKETQLINLISKVESQTLEFKGSWSLSIDLYILPKEQRKQHENKWWNQSSEVSKAVASMLNANKGGKIYIGVLENKKKYRSEGFRDVLKNKMHSEELKGGNNLLLGIGVEVKAKGWDSDTLIQNINNQLKIDIHDTAIQYCIIKSRTVKNKEIIEINISENSFVKSGWWINDEELPVRENNQINTMRGGTANRWLVAQVEKYA